MPIGSSFVARIVLAAGLGSVVLQAQVPLPLRPSTPPRASATTTTVLPGKLPPATAGQPPALVPAPGNTATPAAMDPAEAQRLAKWKQLLFDRRRSAALRAWAAPELKPYDPSEEQKPVAPEVRELIKAEFGVDPNEVGRQPAPALPDAQRKEKELQREFEMVQRDVTLSRWERVAKVFATFPEPTRKEAYEHFLGALLRPPQTPQDQQVPQHLQEKNAFTFADVFALAGMAPGGLQKPQLAMLAALVARAIESGNVLEELLRTLVEEAKAAAPRINRRQAALLLSGLGQEVELGPFLPDMATATANNDREAFNLMARHALAQFEKEKRSLHLETAWQATQAALAQGDVNEEDKAEALRRAVELAPRVRAELGPAWLAESFSKRPERGMEIIATIGQQVARGFSEKPQDPAFRAKGLQLQKTAVDALLAKAPELGKRWNATLALLAGGWITEALHSNQFSKTDSVRPVMQRDAFGNIFWTDMRMGGGGAVVAVEPMDLIAAQPGAAWAAALDAAMLPHFLTVSSQLLLKVDEAEKAFPFIEQLAAVNPRKARELADEFLRVWGRKSNPNRGRTNSYMFMYGFEQRANGIPLTRSKQERNLAQLADWVERLNRLPIGGVDQKLLSEAFATAHSIAEVPRLETIQKVFGDVAAMDPVLLGELLQKMRTNLATTWRVPAVQEAQKTRRSQKQMLEQVSKGYETTQAVAALARAKQGDHWALLSVQAAVLHDQNNFDREQKRSSKFADARKQAFATFADAARDYVARADQLRLDEETVAAFDVWFYAALGACDLGAIDEETVVAKSQLPLIKAALASLSGVQRERHEAMFANLLFTRMSAVKPQIKQRYLEAGFTIVGDHPQAEEARAVYQYYQDLLGELKLQMVLDGAAEIGTAAFGARVDIVHSPEIERESGGFAKYAQNQNNNPYSYNYGRPLENYRDRFQEALNAALDEHFEVLSVTFNSEAMESAPTADPAWRRTSYAYVLLKARGPQVDRIPPVKLDFDFLDTSGYTVLAVGTEPVVVDASRSADGRPFADVTVTQVLDERRADEGKITLEVKANATGLVPDFAALLHLATPGFRVAKIEDQGVSVVKFAEDQDAVLSERAWLLALEPEAGERLPQSFRFARPLAPETKAVYQRFADADLLTVDESIALHLAEPATSIWVWLGLLAAFCGFFAWYFLSPPGGRAAHGVAEPLRLPARIDAFSTLQFLAQVRQSPRLSEAARAELDADSARIERDRFRREGEAALDLTELANAWLARTY